MSLAPARSQTLHAGLLARRRGGLWRGVLVLGPSGAGKSDLALRAIGEGWSLVADDRTIVFLSAGRVYGRAPGPLGGLLEARGVGVCAFPVPAPLAEVVLVLRAAGPGHASARIHEGEQAEILGRPIPVLALSILEASASAKMTAALEHLGGRLGGGPHRGYQACPSRPRTSRLGHAQGLHEERHAPLRPAR